MAEAASLCTQAIADAANQRATGMRPLRAGDYSFNQIGPTAFYMLLSNIPIEERRRRGYYAVGGNGGSPTWHTPNDLPAVASLPVLRRDLEIYLTTIVRVVNAPLHPFDYTAAIDEIATAVGEYRDRTDGELDLSPIADDLARLSERVRTWTFEAGIRASSGSAAERRRANATLRRLARILIPLNYSKGERFDHDPAIKLPAVPRLELANRLASATADQKRYIRTALVRERNKIRAMLRAAMREVE